MGGMDSERAAEQGETVDERREALHSAVADVMTRIVGGERSAVWDLHTLSEPHMRRIIRAEARRIDIRIGDEDVLDLSLDAAIDLAKIARAWQPGGALPWVWARRRIAALVHGHVGTFAKPLDETHFEIEERAAPASVESPRALLRLLAERHPAARSLEERLSLVASDRDADVWLGVVLEQIGRAHV